MFRAGNILAGLALIASVLRAESQSDWKLAHSQHFEVYSQAGEETAHSALLWFEQLRAFFVQQTRLVLKDGDPVRVIGFGSEKEYSPYRLRPATDAYYVGTANRDYIVVPALNANNAGLAAHEYSHLVLHANGLHFDPWLEEGLAEYFSSVQITPQGTSVGSALPARVQYLQRHKWMAFSQLVALPEMSPLRSDRRQAELFYSESWALTNMLLLSSDYAPQFSSLIAALDAGKSSEEALLRTYGKSLATLTRECLIWINQASFPVIVLPRVTLSDYSQQFADVSPFSAQLMIAELLLSDGDLGKAESLYQDLEKQDPKSADVKAALGTIAIINRQYDKARELWREAVELGVQDANLCYRYALMAQSANLAPETIRGALTRAVTLRPDFDDARYRLALVERNAGNYETALHHLELMKTVAPGRAFVYWSAMASTLTELDRREEAVVAALQAESHAANPSEQGLARQLRYLAQTDLTVQFARDDNGSLHLETARMPHKAKDWNPFIEPTDRIHKTSALLKAVGCTEGKITSIEVEAEGRQLRLAIPDPLHLQITNGPAGFTCGQQMPVSVKVVYALSDGERTDGLVRGLDFAEVP